jgi:hypothetical protein
MKPRMATIPPGRNVNDFINGCECKRLIYTVTEFAYSCQDGANI